VARGPEFAGLEAGGEGGEPGDQAAEPGINQEDKRPGGSVGGDPSCHRLTQSADDDEAESFLEAPDWGGRC
jgi:hypothetical protein